MWVDRAVAEAALRQAETDFANLHPLAISLLLVRARALDALGHDSNAMRAYIDLLRLDGRNFDGLTGFAGLLLRMGHPSAARRALARAVEARPDSAFAHVNLATALIDTHPKKAREGYERALRLDPNHSAAHRGLAMLQLREGEVEEARKHGRIGFSGHFDCWPYRGDGRPVTILWVHSALGGNVPIEFLLDSHVFHRYAFAAEFFEPGVELPSHDVVFNALGDPDFCGSSFDAVEKALDKTTAPIVNRPSAVRSTGRLENARRLSCISGLVTPRVAEFSREVLASAEAPQALMEARFAWPLLVRSPGFHTGEHFVKVDAPEGLADGVASLPGDKLLVLQFLDTRGADGFYRKYRTMIVDGRLHPLHLAVSAHWKVHYFSSDMADRADHRREDEAFLEDMPGVLGPRAMQSLEGIRNLLDLDYGGIDFALDGEGRVVVFEANATMVIVKPADDPRWSYRVAPVERVQKAVVRMLRRRAGRADESER